MTKASSCPALPVLRVSRPPLLAVNLSWRKLPACDLRARQAGSLPHFRSAKLCVHSSSETRPSALRKTSDRKHHFTQPSRRHLVAFSTFALHVPAHSLATLRIQPDPPHPIPSSSHFGVRIRAPLMRTHFSSFPQRATKCHLQVHAPCGDISGQPQSHCSASACF